MKYRCHFFVATFVVLLSAVSGWAQGSSSVENMRSQLRDLQSTEDDLQKRLKQIDEDLKPENIERFFALNGSTRPEELREQRRKSLESQRALLQSQVDQVAASRVRLQTGISAAEAASYTQSALPSSLNSRATVTSAGKTSVTPKRTIRRTRRQRGTARRRRG